MRGRRGVAPAILFTAVLAFATAASAATDTASAVGAADTPGATGTSDAAGTAGATGTAGTGAASGLDDNGQMRDPALQERFERITHQLRCLVCQNESIADSNVELARDLRRQVRDMLMAHDSDDAVYKFMTDRYGEFVRFAPPLEPKTLIIWGAPFVMVLIGGFIVIRVARQRAQMPIDE